MADYRVPGEFLYDGLVMGGLLSKTVLDKVPAFKFRPDDVLINTYPKAGTTWAQQIVWLIMNNADIETSRKVPLFKRTRFLEACSPDTAIIDILPDIKSQRIIKSHLPVNFFRDSIDCKPENAFKIILMLRNIKDVLVSYYHFYRMNTTFGNFDRTFDDFFRLFQARRLVYGDYFDHVLGWWKERENPNIHIITYEDLKADPKRGISRLASFLGKTLSESQLDVIVDESSFKAMQEDPNFENVPLFKSNISKFIRKGEVGDWQNYFTEEQIQYVDARCERELAPHGLKFRDKW